MHLISWALPPGETDKPVSGKPSLHVESPEADGKIKLGVEPGPEPAPVKGQPVQPKPVAGNPPGEIGKPVSGKPSLHVESPEAAGEIKLGVEPGPAPVKGQPGQQLPPVEVIKTPEPPRARPVAPIVSKPKEANKDSSGSDLGLGLGKDQQKQSYGAAVQPVDSSLDTDLGGIERGQKQRLHVESPKTDGEIKLGLEPTPEPVRGQPVAEKAAPIQWQPVQPKPVTGNPPGAMPMKLGSLKARCNG